MRIVVDDDVEDSVLRATDCVVSGIIDAVASGATVTVVSVEFEMAGIPAGTIGIPFVTCVRSAVGL